LASNDSGLIFLFHESTRIVIDNKKPQWRILLVKKNISNWDQGALWSEKRPKAEKYIKARADDGLNSEKRAMEIGSSLQKGSERSRIIFDEWIFRIEG
jgi:hypothetical protein